VKRLLVICLGVLLGTLVTPAHATVYTFGSNAHSEGCLGHKGKEQTPKAVALEGVVEVKAGYFSTYLRSSTGLLYSCGGNAGGQAGQGIARNAISALPGPVPLAGVQEVAIAGGDSHPLALLNNGTVVQWGCPIEKKAECHTSPVPVPGLSGVVQVAHGGGESYALLAAGTVTEWRSYEAPHLASGLRNISAIAAGGVHEGTLYALLRDGTVKTIGAGKYGQRFTTSLRNIVQIASGGNWLEARDASGNVLTLGEDFAGALGYQTSERCGKGAHVIPCSRVPRVILSGVSDIAAGTSFGLAVKAGKVYEWGRLGLKGASPIGVVKGLARIRSCAGDEHHLACLS
jgi:alpha-tubulin suppressor-like RCC1 family protein